MLDQIHKGHFAIEKCRSRAHEVLFWPGMNADTQHIVTNCNTCMSFQNANAKEPLINHEIPTLPWQIVGSDLFSLYVRDYVVIVDYCSRYPEVERLYDTWSSAVIKKIKSILSRHGKCQKMISDNGPQYISDEFAKFAFEWEFNHTTSSPKHAQSNGLAERAVQTLKQLVKKAKAEHKDPYLSLLELRNTPVDGLASPTLPSQNY